MSSKQPDEKYKNFFYNTETLENVYNILKGDNNQLKRDTIKKLISDYDSVDFEEIKISSPKKSEKDKGDKDDVKSEGRELNSSNTEYISFEEFCEIFRQIYDNSQENPQKILLEGFCFMDKKKKSYLDIEDLKRLNQVLGQHFTEEELEGIIDLAGKSDGKITFDDFTEFLNSDN